MVNSLSKVLVTLVFLFLVMFALITYVHAQEDDTVSDDNGDVDAADPFDLKGPSLEDEYAEASATPGQPITRVKTEQDLQAFLNPSEAILGGGVIGIFASESLSQFQEFDASAQPLNGNGYRIATSVGAKEVMDHYGVKGESGWKIMVHPPANYISETYGDKFEHRFGGNNLKSDSEKAALKAFINKHSLPLVSRISPVAGNERVFVEQGLPIFVVISKFDEVRDKKGVAYILNRMRKVAEKQRGKMLFGIVDLDDADATRFFTKRFFSKNPEDSDALEKLERIVGIKQGKQYFLLDKSFSVEAAEQFIKDFTEDRLQPVSFQEDLFDTEEELAAERERNMNTEL